MSGLVKAPALVLVLGAVTGLFLAQQSYFIGGVSGVALFILSFFYSKWQVICSLLLGLILCFFHSQHYKLLLETKDFLYSYSDTSFQINVSEARVLQVEYLPDGCRATVRVLSSDVIFRGAERRIPKGSIFNASSDSLLYAGEIITFNGHVKRNFSYANFGEEDWSVLRSKRGEAAAITISEHQRISWNLLREKEYALRIKLKKRLIRSLRVGVSADSPSYKIIPAVLFGEKPEDPQWMKPYRDVGVMHMFVVSGLHVGMVMGGAWMMFYFLPVSTKKALIGALLLTWLYSWLSGLDPPVFRSVLVITIYVLGLLLNRRVSALNSLLIAFLAVVCINPYTVNEVGVWLSFGVVLGLISLGGFLLGKGLPFIKPDPYLPRALWLPTHKARYVLLKWFLGFLLTSVIAWCVSSLITMGSFGKIYSYGIIASWLILPAIFLILMTSGVVVFFSLFFTESLAPINQLNHHLCEYVVKVVDLVDDFPHLVYHVDDFGYKDSLTVFNLPKGGGCLFLGTDKGILVDVGSLRAASSTVLPILENAGVRVHDVILSHRDSAHTGGRESFEKANIIEAYESHGFIRRHEGWTIESIPLRVPFSARGDDNVALIKMSKGGSSILYISDAGYSIFKELVKSGRKLPCDVLIVGKNGYDEDCVQDFCAYTGAQHLILGRSYFYHPKRKVIGVSTYDQRFNGAVRIKIKTTGLEISAKESSLENLKQ